MTINSGFSNPKWWFGPCYFPLPAAPYWSPCSPGPIPNFHFPSSGAKVSFHLGLPSLRRWQLLAVILTLGQRGSNMARQWVKTLVRHENSWQQDFHSPRVIICFDSSQTSSNSWRLFLRETGGLALIPTRIAEHNILQIPVVEPKDMAWYGHVKWKFHPWDWGSEVLGFSSWS